MDLKNPSSTTFDFTYQSPSNSKIESLSEMILVQISKQSFLERRNSSLFNCNYDSFGNEFCPSNLAKAESYWDYDNGFSIPKVGQVVDYTKKETTINYTQANYQLQQSTGYCSNIIGSDGSDICGKVSWQPYTNVSEVIYQPLTSEGGKKFRINNGVLEHNTAVCIKSVSDDQGERCSKSSWGSWIIVSEVIYESLGVGIRAGGGKFKLKMTCQSGSVLENNQCKTSVTACPQGYTETTGAETSKGECKGNIDYSYYEYKCNEEKNGQNNNYQIINNGGDCNKSDTNNKTVNPELSNSCNSSTPPVNNCKRQGFKCNSNEIKPVYVNGEWQCSPFLCDSNMKCGYATCNSPSIPSTSKFQDVAYNPLNYIYNNKCNQDICDYVLNAQVSYCESSQCPKRDDVIEKNGLCYKMECPAGTYLSGDKCIKENF
ncbi:hypothetical protein [Aliarcobacter butzleri]|uniref:hypothetical protein n=1 Tax=Aliarcobacter butzleri TaxID=28197 RepID=UPI0021B2F2BC|nr:hypothetical protein [Aliarcobacter butzleri]MCT7647534.1 hypothetical protein [Aliarcobacter butzleri]